jgi:hypothetical protein
MSANQPEIFAQQATSTNKTTDQKLVLIAKAIAELAKAIRDLDSQVRSLPH